MPARSTSKKTADAVEPRRSSEIETPVGVLRLVTRGETLCALEFTDTPTRPRSATRRQRLPGIMKSLERRLQAYFAGDLSGLSSIKCIRPHHDDIADTFQSTVTQGLVGKDQRIHPICFINRNFLALPQCHKGTNL